MLLLLSDGIAVQNKTTEHKMKNYQFLLFDADNTLFDFDASERLTFFEFAGLYGITANEQTYSIYKKFNLETWAAIEKNQAPKDELLVLRYKKLFDTLAISGDAEKANIDFLKILSTKGILYPETRSLLTRLRAAGKKIYLITNGVAEVQDGRIAATDTSKYFDGIFISETVGASKPAKEFFDAVVSTDSYNYFGRDERDLDEKLLPFVKPGGWIYIAIPGMKKDCHSHTAKAVPSKINSILLLSFFFLTLSSSYSTALIVSDKNVILYSISCGLLIATVSPITSIGSSNTETGISKTDPPSVLSGRYFSPPTII